MSSIVAFPYWFELAVVFGLSGVGNIVLHAFAQHECARRRLGKMVVGAALAVAVSAMAGHGWFLVMVGAILVAVLVIHGWWLPRRGIHGITAEPRDRYLALRAGRRARGF
ncbi:MAG: hypothetical protein RLZZ15_4505 [Verrucomicrobiota bacterium]|jgi:uncharacterized membrane protein